MNLCVRTRTLTQPNHNLPPNLQDINQRSANSAVVIEETDHIWFEPPKDYQIDPIMRQFTTYDIFGNKEYTPIDVNCTPIRFRYICNKKFWVCDYCHIQKSCRLTTSKYIEHLGNCRERMIKQGHPLPPISLCKYNNAHHIFTKYLEMHHTICPANPLIFESYLTRDYHTKLELYRLAKTCPPPVTTYFNRVTAGASDELVMAKPQNPMQYIAFKYIMDREDMKFLQGRPNTIGSSWQNEIFIIPKSILLSRPYTYADN